MTRIAVGGFLHETNTFAPTKATYDSFVHGGGWPAMTHGSDVLRVMRGINVGLAGFVEDAETRGWELVPTIACGASPSAHVTKDAYERIVTEMVDGIQAALPLDAVYLDLHGAMVTEHLDDGESEIAARVRAVIGPDVPFVVSLDLHGNISPELVENTDALIAYRTYPHVDMADTGRAAARHMALLLAGNKFAKAFRQLPFLIPISWQCTNDQPTKGIYEMLTVLEDDQVPTLSFCPGFPAADFPHCCPSVFAYGVTQADADAAADTVVRLVSGHEDDFDGRIYTPDEGVRHAMELAKTASKPIVIADTQDNPGAGGDSDTTGMLAALVRNKATKASIGVIYDPVSAAAAHAAGEGASVTLSLGGKSGIPGDAPYEATFTVEKLSDGIFVANGPYYGGRDMDMGPSACLRIDDVRVVISSHKAQLADQAMYRFVGIEPTTESILVNKSSVHFRADFEPIAGSLLICAAPGAMPADTSVLPWTRLRPGIRLKPNGQPFTPTTPSPALAPANG
ncbi:M81 family metallopeptidase [Tardiphaga sp. vice352]|uniref:M81 family metallopeptidase n=1 Tax=unclassified Tardiphaga TaxID=2631404 RepID=UPI0011645D26|nr:MULTISPECIES: M81 family metallopeptidase [unclassified Tardiphaga]QDM17739.1 M81 family metallopeptidase [Tardiphaga sp. vice278]QDM22799.1 M81 family metallopeptidase [Tardiphaga sp. vice154]QDM27958.1 M81 family metallopeptidase [Tardiphaga sp. vice304]QDM33100.1 M81 family metallopeptidase [Tardiphaga sp. vice352]